MEQVTKSETNRKLASVQIVKQIENHTNSDNLALATILGWQIVIRREEFKVNEKIVYFEIDSKLPEAPWSEFMKARDYKVKTVKLRGEISQGLILPLSILGDVKEADYEEGRDLTETIGVVKYHVDSDEPVTIKGGIKVKTDTFPTLLVEKTDEPRIQSEPKLLKAFQDQSYYATIKYDGTSATYSLDPSNDEFYICSRNQRREFTVGDVYSTVADTYKIKEKLLAQKNKYAIQCEIYGPSIQLNPLSMKSATIAVFNIRDLTENKYLDYEELVSKCKELDLPMVEVVEEGEAFNYSMSELKEKSKGNYHLTKNPREGLVFRLKKEWHSGYNRNSFKIINEDFLVKKK